MAPCFARVISFTCSSHERTGVLATVPRSACRSGCPGQGTWREGDRPFPTFGYGRWVVLTSGRSIGPMSTLGVGPMLFRRGGGPVPVFVIAPSLRRRGGSSISIASPHIVWVATVSPVAIGGVARCDGGGVGRGRVCSADLSRFRGGEFRFRVISHPG